MREWYRKPSLRMTSARFSALARGAGLRIWGALISRPRKQGLQGVNRDQASAAYLDAGESARLHPLIERHAPNAVCHRGFLGPKRTTNRLL